MKVRALDHVFRIHLDRPGDNDIGNRPFMARGRGYRDTFGFSRPGKLQQFLFLRGMDIVGELPDFIRYKKGFAQKTRSRIA